MFVSLACSCSAYFGICLCVWERERETECVLLSVNQSSNSTRFFLSPAESLQAPMPARPGRNEQIQYKPWCRLWHECHDSFSKLCSTVVQTRLYHLSPSQHFASKTCLCDFHACHQMPGNQKSLTITIDQEWVTIQNHQTCGIYSGAPYDLS